MAKKIFYVFIAFLLLLFFVWFLPKKSASNSGEGMEFKGPTDAPHVKGPLSNPPR